jgi:hypothetical protein
MEMKNRILLVALWMFFAFVSAHAQIGISVASGMNISNCRFSTVDGLSPNVRMDYFLSFAPSYQLDDKLRFLVDLQYSRKGYVRDYIFSPIDTELRYSYLDVIPEIEFKVHRFFSIGFGLNYAVVVDEDQKTEPGNWINTKKLETIKQSDFGINSKIKGEYKNVFCFIRCNYGLKNITNIEYTDDVGRTINVSQYNLNLQIGLGYNFNFKQNK